MSLNQINAKGGLPEEQTLINAGRPYHITIMWHKSNQKRLNDKKEKNAETVIQCKVTKLEYTQPARIYNSINH